MLLPQRARRGTTGGQGVREGFDTVKAWSRGVEPFLLVDRFETFLGRVLRWSRHTNGPREKRVRARDQDLFVGLQSISSFSFFFQNRLSIFPSPGIGLHTFFEATRGKRRGTHVARSSSKRRRRSSCGVKRIS